MAEVIQPVYHNFNLGFDDEDVKRVAIAQDSDKTHILAIKLYTNDDQMTLSPTWDYHITMRKPDGKLIVNSENIEVRNNTIYVTCTAQMLSAPGTSKCQLVVYNDDQSLYSNNFYIYVSEDLISGDEVMSTDEFNSLVRVLRQIQQYQTAAQQSAQNASNYEDAAETSKNNAADYEQQIRDILDSLDGYDDRITTLIQQLQTKSAEIDNLKNSVKKSSEDIEALLHKLEDAGADKIDELLNNAQSLYDDLLDLKSEASTKANDIDDIYDDVSQKHDGLTTMFDDVDSRYGTFGQTMDDLEDKAAELQNFYDNMDSLSSSIQNDARTISNTRVQTDDDAAAISAMKTELEGLLEQMRDAVTGAGFDPIIVSSTQPEADAQEADDMWLEPYS